VWRKPESLFGSDLTIQSGLQGDLWVQPALHASIPLADVKVPLLSCPFVADLDLHAGAAFDFNTRMDLAPNAISLSPRA